VTVTGPGGAGKTRLTGEVARRIAGRFADGAWLVELAPVQDSEQVAAALGVREQPGVPVRETVAQVLARQQLLLVVDNCEHVAGAVAQLCAGLLTACDDVRVLTTSREPLAVAGEARYRLGPLALAGPDQAGGWSEAVTLFVDRARGADAHFTADRLRGGPVSGLGQDRRQPRAARPDCRAGDVGRDLRCLPGQSHRTVVVLGSRRADLTRLAFTAGLA
jgi:predicted ATPase